jgi:galactose-1-phosphate uridylyltransferase
VPFLLEASNMPKLALKNPAQIMTVMMIQAIQMKILLLHHKECQKGVSKMKIPQSQYCPTLTNCPMQLLNSFQKKFKEAKCKTSLTSNFQKLRQDSNKQKTKRMISKNLWKMSFKYP